MAADPPMMPRPRAVAVSALAFVALVAFGCASDGAETAATDQPGETAMTLPSREGPRRVTTGTVPHIQIGADPVPDLDAELRRRAFLLPGVTEEPSRLSLPGAVQLALDDGLDLARPDVIADSQEFAHIHPDGSLHVWLPLAAALDVDDKKWGERHPWVDRDGFWEGVVMIYTPETPEDLEVTIRLLVEAYNFVVGASVDPADIA